MNVYHTQEKRKQSLNFPEKCIRDDAWFGEAYYFWREELDADDWGNNSKKRTGFYEVYVCELKSEKLLDTVFNEEHYYFWINQLEKIVKIIETQTGEKPTLKELNDYISDKGIWKDIDFIQFQDLPINTERSLTKPIEYKNFKRTVAFRKRIQIAVYNKDIIHDFRLLKTKKVC